MKSPKLIELLAMDTVEKSLIVATIKGKKPKKFVTIDLHVYQATDDQWNWMRLLRMDEPSAECWSDGRGEVAEEDQEYDSVTVAQMAERLKALAKLIDEHKATFFFEDEYNLEQLQHNCDIGDELTGRAAEVRDQRTFLREQIKKVVVKNPKKALYYRRGLIEIEIQHLVMQTWLAKNRLIRHHLEMRKREIPNTPRFPKGVTLVKDNGAVK